LTFRYVSNVDGSDFAEAAQDLKADETLFIISSKTFTTLETMTNACFLMFASAANSIVFCEGLRFIGPFLSSTSLFQWRP
jgi:glucose-6-phosphate isomerase